MRVAYVCADRGVPVFGCKGSSIHVQEVVRNLVAEGAAVDLFAARVGGTAPAGFGSVDVHRLPKKHSQGLEERERCSLEANDHLRAALGEAGPFDFVYERHSLWSYAGMEYARDSGVPGLLEVNAPLLEEQRRYRGLVREGDARRAVQRAFGAASALLGVSDGVAEYLERQPAARGRVHVVPNGVDPSRFLRPPTTAVPSPTRGTAPMTVGFVGTLKPWHGVEDLVEAFAQMHDLDPHTRLLIVGDGPQRPRLMEQTVACGIENAVDFPGAVAPSEIPPMLASLDVAVAPYPPLEDFYFSPLKLFEYMAAGLSIVAASIGQIRQLIVHGTTGVLYPPGDTAALTAALIRLRADPALRRRLGDEARRVAARDHTWHSVIRRIFELAERHSDRHAVLRPDGVTR